MIPHNRPTLGDAEAEAAARTIRSGFVAAGPEVASFEAELARRLGLPAAGVIACASGTAALFLALRAIGVRGRRVGVPAYACLALRNAVALAGAESVLLDLAPAGPNVDRAAIAAAGVDAAIAVSTFGIPADDDAFAGLPVIDDAAQALGAATGAGPTGTRGAAGIFSFYATKLLTTAGGGGAVVTRDPALAERVRDDLAYDGRDDARPRFNLQLTDVAAAVGRVQLARLDAFLARREAIWRRYRAAGLPLLDAPWSATPVRYRAVVTGIGPAPAIARLREAGATAIVPIEPRELVAEERLVPRAFALARTTLSLPCYPSLEDADVDRVAAAAAEVIAARS